MNDKVEALILKINDYKENDLILEVITKDRGFLSFVAKGAKKITSKKHYYNLCLYEFIIDYKETKTMFTTHNSNFIKSYYDDSKLKLCSFENILFEIMLKSKDLYEITMYQNIIFLLENINDKNMYLLGSLFISYFLKINGISPNVDACVVCGNKKVVGISFVEGGFLCFKHLNGTNNLDVNRLKKFRLINKAEFKNYVDIKDIEYDFEDFKLMIDFFVENADLNLKSLKMYKSLF